MFELTLLDHLRLTFGHVVYRYTVHSQIAHTNAQRSRWLRGAEVLLMTGVALSSLAAAVGKSGGYSILSAILAGVALVTLLLHMTFDLDASVLAHRACATRLWRIREQYQALLSDLCDGAIDLERARERRDVLMQELHGIYENAPPLEQRAYKAAGHAVMATGESPLSDEEIDTFLPKSLQKTARAATAWKGLGGTGSPVPETAGSMKTSDG
jgi:SMODS and SLOG-associating 2TM effector domain family 4